MKTWVRDASPVSRPAAALLATLLLLGSCGGGNDGSSWPAFLTPGSGTPGPGTTAPPAQPLALPLPTLSTRPDIATGRGALVGIDTVHVPPHADTETMERLRQQVEIYLNEAPRRAYAAVGRPEGALG